MKRPHHCTATTRLGLLLLAVVGGACSVPLETALERDLRVPRTAPALLDLRASEVELSCDFTRSAVECDAYAGWIRQRVVDTVNRTLRTTGQSSPARVRITLTHHEEVEPWWIATAWLIYPALCVPHSRVVAHATVELETSTGVVSASGRGRCHQSVFGDTDTETRECAIGRGVALALSRALEAEPPTLSAGAGR